MGSRKPQARIAVLLILTVVCLCVVACVSRSQAPSAEAPQVLNIKTLLIVPFNIASERYEVGTTVRCSMCGAVFLTGPVALGADSYMTEEILTFLKAETPYTLIPAGVGEGARSKIVSESVLIPKRDLLLETGRKLEADAVVSGTIFRFRQRIGTKFSVDTPASVAFSIYLLRVADGRLIWDGHFDETQQPLSENLFKLSSFVKRGGAWLTAEELAGFGFNKVMASFPVP